MNWYPSKYHSGIITKRLQELFQSFGAQNLEGGVTFSLVLAMCPDSSQRESQHNMQKLVKEKVKVVSLSLHETGKMSRYLSF